MPHFPDKHCLKNATKAILAVIADPYLKDFFQYQMAIRFFKRTGSGITDGLQVNRQRSRKRSHRLTSGKNDGTYSGPSLFYSSFYGLPIGGLHAEVSVARRMIDAMAAERNRVAKNREKLCVPGLGATESTEDPLHQ